jgi:dTDP-glucose pyrophosphorylase
VVSLSHTQANTISWTRAVLTVNASLADAIRNLDQSGLQIVLVVTGDNTLVGTVTDGDIRRGLLRGLELSSSIDGIVYRQPLVVTTALGKEQALQLMQANKIHQLPVVDDRRRVTGLHVWMELLDPETRPNMMVIMAGGEGSRLRPLTDSCPKPLLPVRGKPMIEHIIDQARSEGFMHFRLAIRYLGHMIEEHFGDGSRWNIDVQYLRETKPLGTAGALGLLDPSPNAAFLVANGDVLTDIRYGDLLDFHLRHGAAATMAVRLHEWQHPFGVVRTSGVDIIGFEEKPISRSHVNAGVYVLEPHALEVLLPGERCDMPTLFARLQERGARAIVYPMHEPWLDVGRLDDLERAQTPGAQKYLTPSDSQIDEN